eukprot:5869539-Pyramimonas_sp.AAC.1
MIHDVFRRAWALAFGKEKPPMQAGDPDDAGLQDFHVLLSRRIVKVTRFLQQESDMHVSVLVPLLSEPLDDLTLELLSQDTHGRLLLDIASPTVNPIAKCQRELFDQLRPESDSL